MTSLASLLIPGTAARADPDDRAEVWLAVSDIHLNIFDRSSVPSPNAEDANPALLQSALVQMKRVVRNPAVILIPGDFLMHNFKQQAMRNRRVPDATAIQTMRWIARELDRAFPNARFAIALGNNDIPCGDYRSDDDSTYLAALARVWAPLVNRHRASPGFASSFAHGGYYTAQLPVHGMQLVVLNTVLLSREYMGDCHGDAAHAASKELLWLQRTLHATRPGTRNVVMMHIPPGVDAFSTDYLHGFLIWPFLRAGYNRTLIRALAAPQDRVAYAIASHVHRFDFRLVQSVPMIVLGSLSPIYGNNPAFYALAVSSSGSLRDISVQAFDESIIRWLPLRSFDQTWNLNRVDAASLLRLHAQLGSSVTARARWAFQESGWPTDPNVAHGTWDQSGWRVWWCAQILVNANFARCAGIERRTRALLLLLVGMIGVITVLVLATPIVMRRAGDASRGRL